MPYELRPEPQPKLDPANDPSKQMLWERFIYPAIEKLNINMKLPDVSPHPYTGVAFEGYHYAKEHGRGKEYNDRVFRAFYQEDKNIGEIDVLSDLAFEIGLDKDDFREALSSGKYRALQKELLIHAYNEAEIVKE